MPLIFTEQAGFQTQYTTNNSIRQCLIEVLHGGSIFKLFTLGVLNQLINLIKLLISNRTFQIKLNGHRSIPDPIQTGVFWDSCLSPYLFSIFVNDMPQYPDSKIAIRWKYVILYYESLLKINYHKILIQQFRLTQQKLQQFCSPIDCLEMYKKLK